MIKRWIHSKDAPPAAELIRSLPALGANEERTRQLDRQLRARLQDRPRGWPSKGASLKVALSLAALGGVAAAAALSGLAIDSAPTSPAPTSVDQTTESELELPRDIRPRPALEPEEAAPAQSVGVEANPGRPGDIDLETALPGARHHDEQLVVDAVRALKRDDDPRRAHELAERYLAAKPEGPLAREAREVLARAKLRSNTVRAREGSQK